MKFKVLELGFCFLLRSLFSLSLRIANRQIPALQKKKREKKNNTQTLGINLEFELLKRISHPYREPGSCLLKYVAKKKKYNKFPVFSNNTAEFTGKQRLFFFLFEYYL